VINALNTLCAVSHAQNLTLNLDKCEDLLQILLDLLEESLEKSRIEAAEEVGKPSYWKRTRRSDHKTSYAMLLQDTNDIVMHAKTEKRSVQKEMDLVMNIMTILINLCPDPGNRAYYGRCQRLHGTIIKLIRWPDLSSFEELTVRKLVLEFYTGLGPETFQLSNLHKDDVLEMLMLFLDFIDYEGSTCDIHKSPMGEAPDHWIDLGADALSRVLVLDENREVIANRSPPSFLIIMFDVIWPHFPVDYYHFLGSDGGLAFVERIAHILYSIAFIGNPEIHQVMLRREGGPANGERTDRTHPKKSSYLVETMVRLYLRFVNYHRSDFSQNVYGVLLRRMVETIGLLAQTDPDLLLPFHSLVAESLFQPNLDNVIVHELSALLGRDSL